MTEGCLSLLVPSSSFRWITDAQNLTAHRKSGGAVCSGISPTSAPSRQATIGLDVIDDRFLGGITVAKTQESPILPRETLAAEEWGPL